MQVPGALVEISIERCLLFAARKITSTCIINLGIRTTSHGRYSTRSRDTLDLVEGTLLARCTTLRLTKATAGTIPHSRCTGTCSCWSSGCWRWRCLLLTELMNWHGDIGTSVLISVSFGGDGGDSSKVEFSLSMYEVAEDNSRCVCR